MSDQPTGSQAAAQPEAGPSSHPYTGSAPDANVLRQFVMEYLQSHGFDKALESFRAAGGDSTVDPAEGGEKGSDGREAIFRAPGPVPIESTLKRNIPQAQTVSASTMSQRITPDFEAQAKYIIDQLQKKSEAVQNEEAADADGEGEGKPGGGEGILDPSERVEGYRKYRRWVDNGLDLWKAELDGLCFPLFAHTFLDLLNFGFRRAARQFFEKHRGPLESSYPQEISSLSALSNKQQMRQNELCQRLLNEKYTVPLSRNSHDLLIQWLSGAGLDEDWEAGLHNSSGRAKEAVKAIVFGRINISVSQSPMPLDKITLASSSGLISSQIAFSPSLQKFNSTITLKLGPPPKTDRLKEQIQRTLQDEQQEQQQQQQANGHQGGEGANGGQAGSMPNGTNHDGPNGAANGDVEMSQPQQPPAIQEIRIEPDTDPSLISPGEGETHPPTPQLFRIADLKREVEAVRDRRKMIRMGAAQAEEGKVPGGTAVLPSVVAFTVFDGGEGVEFSQDSSLLAVGSPESSIRIWSVKGDKLRAKSIGSLKEDAGLSHRKLIGHSGPVYSLSFDPIYGTSSPPSALLSSSQDGTVRLWSMDTYSNLVVYRGHGRDPVWDVEWGPMGVYFASASRDRTARLWSSDRVAPLRMYTGHLSDVNCLRFHPNSLYLATGSADNSCRLWDVQRGSCIRLFLGHSDAVTTLAISPDGKMLASAGLDRSIWLWDLGSSRPLKKMEGHRGPINSLSFSAESSMLVSGSADCTVRCWDINAPGGEKARADGGGMGDSMRRTAGAELGGGAGRVPMAPGEAGWDDNSTSDLRATFHTKRTPVLKAHYTPRNLCMIAGAFVPPSNEK